MPSAAEVAHAPRVGRVEREPAFRTSARHHIAQGLQAPTAAETQGVHITRANRIGESGLGWRGFFAFHGCAFSSRFGDWELYPWATILFSDFRTFSSTPHQARELREPRGRTNRLIHAEF